MQSGYIDFMEELNSSYGFIVWAFSSNIAS